MSEQYKDLVRRSIEEVWNQGNVAAVDDYVSSDFVVHGSTASGEIHGPDGVRAYFEALRSAFPDLHFTVEEQIADGDRVATRWTAEGTHTGEFQGIPPTGIKCHVAGHDIDRIADGKIVECWSLCNELGLLMQLGIVPSTEAATP